METYYYIRIMVRIGLWALTAFLFVHFHGPLQALEIAERALIQTESQGWTVNFRHATLEAVYVMGSLLPGMLGLGSFMLRELNAPMFSAKYSSYRSHISEFEQYLEYERIRQWQKRIF